MNQKRTGIGVAAVAAVAVATGFLLRRAPEPVVTVSAPPTMVTHASSPTALPTDQPDAIRAPFHIASCYISPR